MLAEKLTPTSHAGEDQTSNLPVARVAHWDFVDASILCASGLSAARAALHTILCAQPVVIGGAA
jgi:hypothetical protein